MGMDVERGGVYGPAPVSGPSAPSGDISYTARKAREAAVAARIAREAEEAKAHSSDDEGMDGNPSAAATERERRRQFYKDAGVPDPDAGEDDAAGDAVVDVMLPKDGIMELF
jgi:hypothetical protein